MKTIPKLPIFVIVILLIGYWIYNGPAKELSYDIVWSIEEETKNEIPVFQLYYVWNGIRESEPTWTVLPKNGKWRVLDMSYVRRIIDPKNILLDEFPEYKSSWVENLKFDGKGTRGEAVMQLIGFYPTFSLERRRFHQVLDDIDNFERGVLTPESTNAVFINKK